MVCEIRLMKIGETSALEFSTFFHRIEGSEEDKAKLPEVLKAFLLKLSSENLCLSIVKRGLSTYIEAVSGSPEDRVLESTLSLYKLFNAWGRSGTSLGLLSAKALLLFGEQAFRAI